MPSPQLINVTISSDNPKYPNHFVNVLVDNDLSGAVTVNVAGTYFPYIIEFTGYPPAEGKRYISEWLFGRLSNEYKTNLGRVLFNLQKDISAIPYYTLNYTDFRNKIIELKSQTIEIKTETGPKIAKALEYVGSDILQIDAITPEYILQWLDFPIKDGEGLPVEIFPLLLPYVSSGVLNIDLIAIGDRLNREYIVEIQHDVYNPLITYPQASYNKILNDPKYNFASGEYSRVVTYQKIQTASEPVTLDKMLTKALNPSIKTLLPGTNLAGTAQSVMNKLKQLQNLENLPLPKLPKIPRINLSKFVVALRVKFTEKKNIKRVKKSKKFNRNTKFINPTTSKLASTLSSQATKLKNLQQLSGTSALTNRLATIKAQAISQQNKATSLINSIPTNITV